jgi:hypothetical protein
MHALIKALSHTSIKYTVPSFIPGAIWPFEAGIWKGERYQVENVKEKEESELKSG